MVQQTWSPLTRIGGHEGPTSRCVRFLFRRLAQAYFRLDVRGLQHVPKQGGAIIAGNHPSVLDGILLGVVSPRPVRFLVAEDLYNHPLLYPLFRAAGSIQVYRTKTHNGDALQMAVNALEQGEVIGIFPEGTVSFGGTMRHAKQGVALLALRTGCPVIPLAIQGSREAFPPDAKIAFPRRIQLHFDAPITFPRIASERIPEDQVDSAREQIRQHIANLVTSTQMRPAEKRLHRASWLKWLSIATAALIVVPLARLLTLTSRPSLDPAVRA